MKVALYQPEIPQNSAAILRTAACFSVPVHIIGPASFDLSQRAVRRAGLDYATTAQLKLHASFADFDAETAPTGRIVLFTTHGSACLTKFAFLPGDTLLFGRESAGVPEGVAAACAARVRIPITAHTRSLNLAVAVAIGLFHALNATGTLHEKGLK